MSSAPSTQPHAHDFGNLRSLLHARPTPQRWDELCALIDHWPCPVDLVDRILPYTCAQLSTWPDALRTISADARAQCISRTPPACTALCVELDLSYHYFLPAQRITNTSFSRMLGADWFGASATHLDLSNHPIGDEALAALATSPLLAGLTHITLDYTCVTHSGLAALARSPLNTRLTSLCLTNLDLDDRAITALADGELLTRLTHLDVSRNHLSDRAISILTTSPHQLALTHLDCSFNAMTDAAAFELAAAKNIGHITRLALDYNDVGLAGWRAMMHAPHLWHAEVSCYPVR